MFDLRRRSLLVVALLPLLGCPKQPGSEGRTVVAAKSGKLAIGPVTYRAPLGEAEKAALAAGKKIQVRIEGLAVPAGQKAQLRVFAGLPEADVRTPASPALLGTVTPAAGQPTVELELKSVLAGTLVKGRDLPLTFVPYDPENNTAPSSAEFNHGTVSLVFSP